MSFLKCASPDGRVFLWAVTKNEIFCEDESLSDYAGDLTHEGSPSFIYTAKRGTMVSVRGKTPPPPPPAPKQPPPPRPAPKTSQAIVTRRKLGPVGKWAVVNRIRADAIPGHKPSIVPEMEMALNGGVLAHDMDVVAARLGQHQREIFRVSLETIKCAGS